MGISRVYKNLFYRLGGKPGEETLAILLFSYFFLITAPHTMIKALRYTDLLRTWNTGGLPIGYLLAAVITGAVLHIHSKVQFKISKKALIISSIAFFIITGFIIQIFMSLSSGRTLSLIIWIWASVLTVVLLTHFWLTLNEVYDTREARRLIGFCGSGGPLGGVFGGLAATALTQGDLTFLLLPAALLLLMICLLVVKAIYRFSPESVSTAPPPDSGSKSPGTPVLGFKDSFKTVRTNRYLILIAGIVFMTVVISTIIDFQFNAAVNTRFHQDYVGQPALRVQQMQAFYGLFFAGLTAIAFFLQILFTRRFLDRLGIGTSLLIAPLFLLFGSVGVFFYPLLISALLIKGCDKSFAFSLNQSVREMLYFSVPATLKNKAKPFIDIFVNRFAKAAAAVFLLILFMIRFRVRPGESPIYDFEMVKSLSLYLMGFIAVWIVLNLKTIKQLYPVIEAKIKPVKPRLDTKIPEILDIELAELVVDTLESRTRSSVLYALHLMDLLERKELTPEIKKAISQKADEITASSIVDLFNAEGAYWFPEKEDEADLDLFLADIKEIYSHEAYQTLMTAYADKLLHQPHSENAKMELAKLIGRMDPDAALVERLDALIEDESPYVAHYAIQSAARLKKAECIPVIISKLSRAVLRSDAEAALVEYGDNALRPLAKYLRNPNIDLNLRKSVAGILARMGTQGAVDMLIWGLGSKDEDLETDIIDALDRIRSTNEDAEFPQRILKDRTLSVMKKYCAAFVAFQGPERKDEDAKKARVRQREIETHYRNLFKLLGLYHPRHRISQAYQNLSSDNRENVRDAVELLDLVLKRDIKARILAIIEAPSPSERARACRRFLDDT